MRSIQTLPILFASGPSNAIAKAGLRRSVSDYLPRMIALTRELVRAATDHRQMSADTLRDLGLVRSDTRMPVAATTSGWASALSKSLFVWQTARRASESEYL